MTPGQKHIAGLELAPCPFCGKEAELRQYDGDHFAQCLHCFCSTPADFGTEGEAAQAWNARAQAAPEPVQGGAVELQHMAVAEDGELRWMSGRKVANCELYAMPDFGRAPKLYTAPPSPDAELVGLLGEARDWVDSNSCHGTDALDLMRRIDAKLAELCKGES
jgi:hypothetical protein